MQKILFFTKDGYLIAADIDFSGYSESRKKIELEKYRYYFSQHEYNEISYKYENLGTVADADKQYIEAFDAKNSRMLMKNVQPFNYVKNPENYSNELSKNTYPPEFDKENTIHFDYSIKNEDIDEFVKQLGFKIVAEDDGYEINDVYKPNINMKAAFVDVSARKITFIRNHFTFSDKDYQRLMLRIQKYNLKKQKDPNLDIMDYKNTINDEYERTLFDIYAQEEKYAQTMASFVRHEIHHIKNKMIFDGAYCKEEAKRLQAKDLYILSIEDERSAYLTGTINCLNKYLQSQNLNDFSMFDSESQWLKQKLLELPKEQRLAYATNMGNIVGGSLENFKQKHRKYYDENQVKSEVMVNASKMPSDIKEDEDREFFKMLRSAYYSIEVYDPTTKKMKVKSLAEYITADNEIEPNQDNLTKIIEPARQKIEKRTDDFQTQYADCDKSLLKAARRMQRLHISDPMVVSDVQTFNVSSLYEKNTQNKQSAENKDNNWSAVLKEYWRQFPQYETVCDNANQYKFKISDGSASYTSANDVHLADNCKFGFYKKLLEEPSNKYKVVNFENTLSEEQKIMLYVACINSGRKVKGNVPTDFSMVEHMDSIPLAQKNKFFAIMKAKQKTPANSSAARKSFSCPEFSSKTNFDYTR